MVKSSATLPEDPGSDSVSGSRIPAPRKVEELKGCPCWLPGLLPLFLGLTQPSWREMNLKSFSAACHSGWRERDPFSRAHTGCHLTNRGKITFTRQNGKVLGFVRQKWNDLVFIKYHEKSIRSCQKHKYKHYHVESIYSEGTIWQSREDHSVH